MKKQPSKQQILLIVANILVYGIKNQYGIIYQNLDCGKNNAFDTLRGRMSKTTIRNTFAFLKKESLLKKEYSDMGGLVSICNNKQIIRIWLTLISLDHNIPMNIK